MTKFGCWEQKAGVWGKTRSAVSTREIDSGLLVTLYQCNNSIAAASLFLSLPYGYHSNKMSDWESVNRMRESELLLQRSGKKKEKEETVIMDESQWEENGK